MKLNLVKANINNIPDAPRIVLNLRKQPFFFAQCKGVVCMNEDMDKLDETATAIKIWWESTQPDPTDESVAASDAAWNEIKKLHGVEAARQLSEVHRNAAKEYREKQSTKEAREWLHAVYKELTEEQIEAMRQAGYRCRVADAMWGAMKELYEEGNECYKNFWGDSSDAAGVYGFLLGMEYGKKMGGNGHE